MLKPRSKSLKLLTLCITLVQIFALTATGALTALQPAPQMAQEAAHNLRLSDWLSESFAGLAWGAHRPRLAG
jgi:hypothetical protein